MTTKFNIGDSVHWNSESGRASGVITTIFTEDFDYDGYSHHASEDTPHYEIKSHMSNHTSAHKESELKKIIKYRD